jgi:hypothetical protein
MSDLAVRFKGASDETFYKILAALTLMKGKGYIKRVEFKEKKVMAYSDEWNEWDGKVQFLSREALEIFGTKIRRGGRK